MHMNHHPITTSTPETERSQPVTGAATFLSLWRQQLRTVAGKPWLVRPWLERSRALLQRFTRLYDHLCRQPRAVRRRVQRQMGASLAGAALALAVANSPAHAAAITVDGTTCTLVNAITAANSNTATGGCTAGSGSDTITLAADVTLTAVNNGVNGLPQVSSTITFECAGYTIARSAAAPDFRLLEVFPGGNLTLNQCTLTGGSTTSGAGGILVNDSTLTLTASTVSGNSSGQNGGGIYNSGGTLTLTNSTVSGNTADDGGGIHNYLGGSVTLNNSTITGNTATGDGGGIYNYGTLTLVRSIISGNASAEIYNYSSATVSANNYNLIGYSNSARSQNFTPSGTDIVPSVALSAILDTTLADNGGDTFTHALVADSPAIDAAGDSGLATDQRGVPRPIGADDDIGAVEWRELLNSHLTVQGSPTTNFVVDPDLTYPVQSPAGVYTITATFRNISAPPVDLHDVYFQVKQIDHINSDENHLLNADGGPGQVGAQMAVANSVLPGGNDLWSQNEDLTVDFVIGLDERRRFTFKVDVYGLVNAAAGVGGTPPAPVYLESFVFTFDPDTEIVSLAQRIFLPFVYR